MTEIHPVVFGWLQLFSISTVAVPTYIDGYYDFFLNYLMTQVNQSNINNCSFFRSDYVSDHGWGWWTLLPPNDLVSLVL
jgi:hypothetical protein